MYYRENLYVLKYLLKLITVINNNNFFIINKIKKSF